MPIDATPIQHATHGISTAMIRQNYRGGHATAPHLKLATPLATRIRVTWTAAAGYDSNPVPRAPKTCRVTIGTLTPYAKQHGIKAMTTWTCTETTRLGDHAS